jgi:hypothetical protein
VIDGVGDASEARAIKIGRRPFLIETKAHSVRLSRKFIPTLRIAAIPI